MLNPSTPFAPAHRWMGYIAALDKDELLDGVREGNLICIKIPACSRRGLNYEGSQIERGRYSNT